MRAYKLLLLSILVLLFCFNKVQAFMGDPIPGADIYIEQEPQGEPIANVTTNDKGEVSGFIPIRPAPAPIPKVIKIFIKFPEKIWKYFAAKYGKTDLWGKYRFNMVTRIGTKKYEKEIFIEIKKPQDIKSLSMNRSGPYAESLSNIEENSKAPPQNSTKKVPFSIRLTCTGVNN